MNYRSYTNNAIASTGGLAAAFRDEERYGSDYPTQEDARRVTAAVRRNCPHQRMRPLYGAVDKSAMEDWRWWHRHALMDEHRDRWW